jgi:hypothetical protein
MAALEVERYLEEVQMATGEQNQREPVGVK